MYEKFKVGDEVYLDYSELFKIKRKDVVATKYGPQLLGKVVTNKLSGVWISITKINNHRVGYYKEWSEYKAIVSDKNLSPKEKYRKCLEVLTV